MASKRDRIIGLKEYIESLGIKVNINKNKAQGNKGYFKVYDKCYRIDIAKGLSEEQIISALVHEFTHFVHYKYDNKLETLNFILGEYDDCITEEMIKITVDSISKKSIEPLFLAREQLNKEIKELQKQITNFDSKYKINKCSKSLENSIKKSRYKHLLKHDRVKVYGLLSCNFYSIESLEKCKELSEIEINYIKLKSKERAKRRISSKISKINKYYNSTTELFARSIELYAQDKDKFRNNYPKLYKKLDFAVQNNLVPELTKILNLIQI
ncbi:MAG: hypothetical protein E7Z92_04970 [Cyanobacteria bacterium SIG31]|nr:hypothetical protein [Cyanobacteria bacterium SIG31]